MGPKGKEVNACEPSDQKSEVYYRVPCAHAPGKLPSKLDSLELTRHCKKYSMKCDKKCKPCKPKGARGPSADRYKNAIKMLDDILYRCLSRSEEASAAPEPAPEPARKCPVNKNSIKCGNYVVSESYDCVCPPGGKADGHNVSKNAATKSEFNREDVPYVCDHRKVAKAFQGQGTSRQREPTERPLYKSHPQEFSMCPMHMNGHEKSRLPTDREFECWCPHEDVRGGQQRTIHVPSKARCVECGQPTYKEASRPANKGRRYPSEDDGQYYAGREERYPHKTSSSALPTKHSYHIPAGRSSTEMRPLVRHISKTLQFVDYQPSDLFTYWDKPKEAPRKRTSRTLMFPFEPRLQDHGHRSPRAVSRSMSETDPRCYAHADRSREVNFTPRSSSQVGGFDRHPGSCPQRPHSAGYDYGRIPSNEHYSYPTVHDVPAANIHHYQAFPCY